MSLNIADYTTSTLTFYSFIQRDMKIFMLDLYYFYPVMPLPKNYDVLNEDFLRIAMEGDNRRV
jgi:hypothetical protein